MVKYLGPGRGGRRLVRPYILWRNICPAVLLCAMVGCGSSTPSSPVTPPRGTADIGTSVIAKRVLIVAHGAVYGYRPSGITIPAGSTVLWTNQTDATHTVTVVNGQPFDSKGLDKGRTFQKTFTIPGTYHYMCLFHTYMQGTVIVTK
jgi:plastocyanin